MIAKIYGSYSADNERIRKYRKKLQELISLDGPTQFIHNINPPGVIFSVPNTNAIYSKSSNVNRYVSYSEKHNNERFSACFPNCPKKIAKAIGNIEPSVVPDGVLDDTYIDSYDLTDEINAIEAE